MIEAPVYRSILFPVLVAGVSRSLFLLIAIGTLAMVVSMGQIWFIAVTVAVYALARYFTKMDIFFFEIYQKLIKFPEALD